MNNKIKPVQCVTDETLSKPIEFGTGKEKDLSKYLSYAVSTGVAEEIFIHFEKVIKLNEELTAENARMLTDNETMEAEIKRISDNHQISRKLLKEANQVNAEYQSVMYAQDLQLTSIKSKWWYKLMMWEW